MSKYLKIAFVIKHIDICKYIEIIFLSNHFSIKYQFNFSLKWQTMNVPAKGGDIAQWLRSLVLPEDGSTQHHLKVAHNHLYSQF